MWYEAGCSRKVEGKYPGGAAGGGVAESSR